VVLNQGPLGDLRKHQWGFKGLFKGIVHPKKKILSSFTHPQAAPKTSMNFFVLQNTKEDIQKNVGNRAVLGHH